MCSVLALLALGIYLARIPETAGEPNSAIGIFLSDGSFSDAPLEMSDGMGAERIEARDRLYYFIDYDRKYEFDEVVATGDFLPCRGRTRWGIIDGVCWFKFDVLSRLSEEGHFFAGSLVDYRPFSLLPGEAKTLYFRMDYHDAGIVIDPVVASSESHIASMLRGNTLVSVVLGVFAALFLYNLFLYIFTKDWEFLLYSLYVFSYGCKVALRHYDISFASFDIPSVSLNFAIYAFAILFLREFLKTRRNTPRVDVYLKCLLAFVVALSFQASILNNGLAALVRIYMIIVMLTALGCGLLYVPISGTRAVFYILSWAPLLVFSLLIQLEQLGLMQATSEAVVFLTSSVGTHYLVAFQALTLSLYLGGRMNAMNKRAAAMRAERNGLIERDRAKTDFFMDVSHELRTPLMIITGIIDGVRKGRYGESIASSNAVFDIADRNGKRLLAQVDNVLGMSRMESKRSDLRLARVDIDELLRGYIDEFEAQARSLSIGLSYENKAPSGMPAYIDTDVFETAIFNLLSNAFKYTGSGGRVSVALDEGDSGCLIEVSDNGIGIPEDRLGSVFERYYRAGDDGERKPAGFGIGLSLVRESVGLLGGSIEAKSAPGVGSTFTIALPISVGVLEDEGTEAEEHGAADTRASAPKGARVARLEREDDGRRRGEAAILVVEDSEDLRNMIVEEIGRHYRAYSASNGIEGLALIRSMPQPSLIVSDVMMPVMDGYEFFNAVRAIDECQDIPFIFITARSIKRERLDMIGAGAMDYIVKPFPMEELLAKVDTIVQRDISVRVKYRESLRRKIDRLFDDSPEGEMPPGGGGRALGALGLSAREAEIAELALVGKKDKEIGAELGLASSTVSNYLRRAYKKLGISGRVELVRTLSDADSRAAGRNVKRIAPR